MPTTVTIEDSTVAAVRLPVPVANLPALADVLEAVYGPGLRLQQRGDFLVVTAPRDDDEQAQADV